MSGACTHSAEFIERAWRDAKRYFLHHHGLRYGDLAEDFASDVALKLAQGNRPFRFRELAWVFLRYNARRAGTIYFSDIHEDFEPANIEIDERANFDFEGLLTSKERNDIVRDLERRIVKPNSDHHLYFVNAVQPAVGENYTRNFTKKRSPGARRQAGGWPKGVRKGVDGKAAHGAWEAIPMPAPPPRRDFKENPLTDEELREQAAKLLAELTELCESIGKG